MNFEKPSKLVLYTSVVLIIVNLYLSYIFAGRSIPYVVGNVFGITMMVIAISSLFPKYRNSRSRWVITLNTMIISFMLILGSGLIKTTKKINDMNTTQMPNQFSKSNSNITHK